MNAFSRTLIWLGPLLFVSCWTDALANDVRNDELATLPSNCVEKTVAVTEDGKHYACVAGSRGSQKIVSDGVEGPTFQGVSLPRFSPAGQLFYWALDGQKIILSAGGQNIVTSLSAEGRLVFSKDGARWAAFGAERTQQSGEAIKRGTNVVYVDGAEIGKYADLSVPQFSQDGKHFAFLTLDNGGKMGLVIDGVQTATYEAPKVKVSMYVNVFVNGPSLFLYTKVLFFINGRVVALVLDENGWTVIENGKPVASYLQDVAGGGGYQVMAFRGFEDASSIQGRSLVSADAAPVSAWWEKAAGKSAPWHVVVDGKPADSFSSPLFWAAEPPVLSRDGKHVAYSTSFSGADGKNPEVYAIVDGTKFGPYTNVWGIRLSDDGKHVAYAASDGSDKDAWAYYLDGKQLPLRYSSVYRPVFSTDAAHVSWVATRENSEVLGIDGQEVGTTEQVLVGPVFHEAGVVYWISREGKILVKITAATK